MQPEPESFDLKTLAAETGVAPRTVHFYVQQGLLPPPDGGGRGARYTAVHRDRLRLIRRLQDQHLPLAEIRKHLDRIPDAMLSEVAASTPPPKPRSAADYIRSVLGTSTPKMPLEDTLALRAPSTHLAAPRTAMRPVANRPAYPGSPPAAHTLASRAADPDEEGTLVTRPATDRSQWDRFIVDPDVEIHVRRPGSRASNRKVEKLVDFARSIFKEDA